VRAHHAIVGCESRQGSPQMGGPQTFGRHGRVKVAAGTTRPQRHIHNPLVKARDPVHSRKIENPSATPGTVGRVSFRVRTCRPARVENDTRAHVPPEPLLPNCSSDSGTITTVSKVALCPYVPGFIKRNGFRLSPFTALAAQRTGAGTPTSSAVPGRHDNQSGLARTSLLVKI